MYNPRLRFSVMAWAKLQFYLHHATTEVCGYGVAHNPEDELRINEFAVIKQECSRSYTEMDGEDVDDFFFKCKERGLKVGQYGNIWIHTHPPGMTAKPSSKDESTFKECFSGCQWSVMAIVAFDGDTYARLQYNVGPKMEKEIPIEVDWANWPKEASGSVAEHWKKEFTEKVFTKSYSTSYNSGYSGGYMGSSYTPPAKTGTTTSANSEHWLAQKEADRPVTEYKDGVMAIKTRGNSPGAGFIPGSQPGTFKRPDSKSTWVPVGFDGKNTRWRIMADDKVPILAKTEENVSGLNGIWEIDTNGNEKFVPFNTVKESNPQADDTAGIVIVSVPAISGRGYWKTMGMGIPDEWVPLNETKLPTEESSQSGTTGTGLIPVLSMNDTQEIVVPPSEGFVLREGKWVPKTGPIIPDSLAISPTDTLGVKEQEQAKPLVASYMEKLIKPQYDDADTFSYRESDDFVASQETGKQMIDNSDITFDEFTSSKNDNDVIGDGQQANSNYDNEFDFGFESSDDQYSDEELRQLEHFAKGAAKEDEALSSFLKHELAYRAYIEGAQESDPKSVLSLPGTCLALISFYDFHHGDKVQVANPITEFDTELHMMQGEFIGWIGVPKQHPYLARVKFECWPEPTLVHPDSLTKYEPVVNYHV